MTDQEKNDIDTERCFVLWTREMQKRIHQNAVEKGFWGENGSQNNIGEKIALVHSELSEALEALRTVGLNGKSEKVDGATAFGEEVADAIIRLMDLCGYVGCDIGDTIVRKHAYNLKRPYLHGKRF